MDPRRWASFFFLLVLLLASCSSASPAPAQTSVDTGAPTTTLDATPTESKELSATPTTVSEELEIVESFGWIDSLGDYRVEMLVRNPYDHPLADGDIVDSQVRVLDASGQVLVQHEIYLGNGSVTGGLGQILPGETIPAISCLSCGRSEIVGTLQGLGESWADNLSIDFDLEPSLPLPYSTDFEVRVDFFGAGFMEGAVKYLGTMPVGRAFIRVLLYDPDGRYVGWGEGTVTGEFNQDANNFFPIAPDTWLPFSAIAFPTKVEQDLDYEVTVIGNGCLGLVSVCQEEMLRATPQS